MLFCWQLLLVWKTIRTCIVKQAIWFLSCWGSKPKTPSLASRGRLHPVFYIPTIFQERSDITIANANITDPYVQSFLEEARARRTLAIPTVKKKQDLGYCVWLAVFKVGFSQNVFICYIVCCRILKVLLNSLFGGGIAFRSLCLPMDSSKWRDGPVERKWS